MTHVATPAGLSKDESRNDRRDPRAFVKKFVVAFAGATGITGLFHLDTLIAVPLTILLGLVGALYDQTRGLFRIRISAINGGQILSFVSFAVVGLSCFFAGYLVRQPLVDNGVNIPNLRIGAGTPTWSQTGEEIEGHHGVNTFRNASNASGVGPQIPAGAKVAVSCKVLDPKIVSSNPDGFWYRISQAPWNNKYYAPANTFMNGDPWDGPYTHNTDFEVPDC